MEMWPIVFGIFSQNLMDAYKRKKKKKNEKKKKMKKKF